MAHFNTRICKTFNLNCLFTYQEKALSCLLDGKDVFVGQRTGRGKSLCYQAFTTAAKDVQSIVIIFSPLLAIMEEQTDYLNRLGITAVMLGKDAGKDKRALEGHYQYIFTSPEILLSRVEWRSAIKTPVFRDRVKLISVDEAHLVILW